MTYAEPPPLKPSDDLEGLLRAFFRRQMPNPWPSPRVPSRLRLNAPPTLSHKRTNLTRSRWTLAASVALLLLGSLLLPRRFTENAKPEPILNAPGTANKNILPKRSNRHASEQGENSHNEALPVEDDDRLPEMDDADLRFMK